MRLRSKLSVIALFINNPPLVLQVPLCPPPPSAGEPSETFVCVPRPAPGLRRRGQSEPQPASPSPLPRWGARGKPRSAAGEGKGLPGRPRAQLPPAPSPVSWYLVQGCQSVHVGGVDAGAAAQQALHLLRVPAGASGQEDGALLEADAGPPGAAVPAPAAPRRHRLLLRQGALPAPQLLGPPQPRRLGPLPAQVLRLRHRRRRTEAQGARRASAGSGAQRPRRHLRYAPAAAAAPAPPAPRGIPGHVVPAGSAAPARGADAAPGGPRAPPHLGATRTTAPSGPCAWGGPTRLPARPPSQRSPRRAASVWDPAHRPGSGGDGGAAECDVRSRHRPAAAPSAGRGAPGQPAVPLRGLVRMRRLLGDGGGWGEMAGTEKSPVCEGNQAASGGSSCPPAHAVASEAARRMLSFQRGGFQSLPELNPEPGRPQAKRAVLRRHQLRELRGEEQSCAGTQ